MANLRPPFWEGIGNKRHRVDIVEIIDGSPNTLGESEPITNVIATRWASIRPVKGKEEFKGQQVQELITHQIRIRAGSDISGINPRWELIYHDGDPLAGDRIFEIMYILNLEERKRELELWCQERIELTTAVA